VFGHLALEHIVQVLERPHPRDPIVVKHDAVLLLDDVRDREQTQRIDAELVQL
jgi:hypothetical protein